MKWKQISAALTGVVLLGAAIATVNTYRFWASADELEDHKLDMGAKIVRVAEVSYRTAIKWEQQELDDTQFLLDECDIKQNCTENQIKRLNIRKREKEETIEELKRDREKTVDEGD